MSGTANRARDARVTLHDMHPTAGDLRAEVLAGLEETPRRIAPKFFYDEAGSRLFEAITQQPEYYPTNTEMSLLEHIGEPLRACLGTGASGDPDVTLVEFGSGASRKIRLLLDAVRPARYLPMDISRDFLLESAQTIAADFPWLDVHAICADYTGPLELPQLPGDSLRLGFFPGSSIGNFDPAAAGGFLAQAHHLLGIGAHLLVGVDLAKPVPVLHDAYNDAAGVTAAFNRNVLTHLNRRLDGNFEPTRFAHLAFYDTDAGCIRMYLRSLVDQDVTLAGRRFALRAGECLHTENSWKYAPDAFLALAAANGFAHERTWTDPKGYFGLFLLRAEPQAARAIPAVPGADDAAGGDRG
jgi:dimethylhistidine N-methyltransferase